MLLFLGIQPYGVRGSIPWGSDRPDADAVECFHVCGLPLWPCRVVHTWSGQVSVNAAATAALLLLGRIGISREVKYNALRLRWSWLLVARALLWPYLFVLCFLGMVPALISLIPLVALLTGGPQPPSVIGIFAACASVPLLCGALLWWLFRGDARDKAIRYVLGPHQFGSSDPTTWTDEHLRQVGDARRQFQADTFAEAAGRFLRVGFYSQAMWAARLATALEDPVEGETLTDQILDNPEVREGIRQVRKKPFTWPEVFRGEESPED